MEVGDGVGLGKGAQVAPPQDQRPIAHPFDVEFPCLASDVRLDPEVEHGPSGGNVLTWRQARVPF
jgi:hypothetical protein